MIPEMPMPPDLTRQMLEEDLKTIIRKGERTVCINPHCFNDTCQGECEDEEDNCECNPDCGCHPNKGK